METFRAQSCKRLWSLGKKEAHKKYNIFAKDLFNCLSFISGKVLELMRPDNNTGKVHTLLTVEVFGVIRSLMSFRLTGGNKDYIIVGSDSGRIVILEYNPTKNLFERVHMETFGKSGCRRIVPGEHETFFSVKIIG